MRIIQRAFVQFNHPASVLGAIVVLSLGCGDTSGPKPNTEPPVEPLSMGSVELTVSTSGTSIDPDGYLLLLDSRSINVAANVAVTIGALSVGTHTIQLDGVASNCTLSGARLRSVVVPAGGAVAVSFSISCADQQVFVAPLAFVELNDVNAGIVVATPNGFARLSPDVGWDLDPAWSPDGSKIVFTSGRDRNSEIWVMAPDGSNRVRLTNDSAFNSRPAWSPDGARIAFVSRRDGNAEIYLMNADGTGQFRLTYNNSTDLEPAWSPDGNSIAFVTDPGGASGGILVISVDGRETRRLTSNIYGDFAPAWSPDGTKIAFSGGLGGLSAAIFVMNADGSGREEYSERYSSAADPTWSPDGRQIAFAAESCAGYYYDDCSKGIVVIRPDHTSTTLTGRVAAQDPSWRP